MWSSIVISLRSWRSAGQQLCEVIVSSVLGVAGWSSTGRCTWSADGVGRLRKQSAWKLPLSRAPADQLFRLQAPPIRTCANSERALGSCWSLGRASTSGWSGSCTASTPIVATTIVNQRIAQSKPSLPARSINLASTHLHRPLPSLFLHQTATTSSAPSSLLWVVSSPPSCLRISSHCRLVSPQQPSSSTDRSPPVPPGSFISLQVRVWLSIFAVSHPTSRFILLPSSGRLFIAVTHTRSRLQISNPNL